MALDAVIASFNRDLESVYLGVDEWDSLVRMSVPAESSSSESFLDPDTSITVNSTADRAGGGAVNTIPTQQLDDTLYKLDYNQTADAGFTVTQKEINTISGGLVAAGTPLLMNAIRLKAIDYIRTSYTAGVTVAANVADTVSVAVANFGKDAQAQDILKALREANDVADKRRWPTGGRFCVIPAVYHSMLRGYFTNLGRNFGTGIVPEQALRGELVPVIEGWQLVKDVNAAGDASQAGTAQFIMSFGVRGDSAVYGRRMEGFKIEEVPGAFAIRVITQLIYGFVYLNVKKRLFVPTTITS